MTIQEIPAESYGIIVQRTKLIELRGRENALPTINQPLEDS